MRCLREIQNIIIGLLYKDRIKTNNKRYNELYKANEKDEKFVSLKYGRVKNGFNYRIFSNHRYKDIFRLNGLFMSCTYIELPKKYL